jgi:hypothetical protein
MVEKKNVIKHDSIRNGSARRNTTSKNYQDEVFYSRESDNYGLRNYQDLISYAVRFNIDLDTACNEFGLTTEETDLVKLMYARDLYKNGMIKFGNIYFNNVQRLPQKSPVVTKFMHEIQRKKKFYQYRPVEKPKILGLAKVSTRR